MGPAGARPVPGDILTVSGVAKRFGGPPVLADIRLGIERGGIFQLIGPNGSGKTTLINVISGLMRPDAGRVEFDGADITEMGLYETYRRGLVRTWQIPQPFYDLATAENVLVSSATNSGESFLLAPLRPRWAADERRVSGDASAVMGIVGLAEQADVRSKNLSGGQQKLLELARALMSGAKMILMDEPIAGVNPTLAHSIFEKITSICRERGITFLIVEHRLDISLQYVDGVFAMDRGRIVAEGPPDEVVKHPAVVASYLGR